ncbi:uncharacterized protein LOC132195777 isoform X2 [Neocloeon triangulifer]|uniref:uncharacterized protein LOC132195777 isoform X2 n=1 Tax=Neocloeon triangulifer TaxID=2078957 RepID=UPI00286EFCE1|nr:uncharacterized protein LOC132195777 isoform X2 [Neocloeon triangulifer]
MGRKGHGTFPGVTLVEKAINKSSLGYFSTSDGNSRENADVTFVLLLHYHFESSDSSVITDGVDEDVQNLKRTFENRRRCKFRELNLRANILLEVEEMLNRCIGHEVPSVLILIVLSHGMATQEELHKSEDPNQELLRVLQENKKLFNCLKLVFFKPCRYSLEEHKVVHPMEVDQTQSVAEPSRKNRARMVDWVDWMHNFVIVYSTVESTLVRRNTKGTLLVRALCDELNNMSEDKSLAHFLTSVQFRVHSISTEVYQEKGKTPEFKIFPLDRKFSFSPLNETLDRGGTRIVQHQLNYKWHWKPGVTRKRRALIFCMEMSKPIRQLQNALVHNLQFETNLAFINDTILQSEKSSLQDYDCFAAFFFSQMSKDINGKIWIECDKKMVPVGEIVDRFLGPESEEWIGKPKLFFFINEALSGEKIEMTSRIDSAHRTKHSETLTFYLDAQGLLNDFVGIFESQKLMEESSLQELLMNLLLKEHSKFSSCCLVSSLQYLLHFPKGEIFVEPQLRLNLGVNVQHLTFHQTVRIAEKMMENSNLCILTAPPGMGKTKLLGQIGRELKDRSRHSLKIFNVRLIDLYANFGERKVQGPSFLQAIAENVEESAENLMKLIAEENFMLMLDGFDEIPNFYQNEAIQNIIKLIKANVQVWISTRPQAEQLITNATSEITTCRFEILPLQVDQQIELLKAVAPQFSESKVKFLLLNSNLGPEVLGNPLHLLTFTDVVANSTLKASSLMEIYESFTHYRIDQALKRKGMNPLFVQYSKKILRDLAVAVVSKGNSWLASDMEGIDEVIDTGIVSVRNGKVNFVHQTYGHFFAAQRFIEEIKNGVLSCPFLLLQDFDHVRKFYDSYLSSEDFLSAPDAEFLEKCITNHFIVNIVIKEDLVKIFQHSKMYLPFADEESLCAAFENSERIALELLEMVDADQTENLRQALVKKLPKIVENNFVKIFSKLINVCRQRSLDLRLISKGDNDKEEKINLLEKAAERMHDAMLNKILEAEIFEAGEKEDALFTAVRSGHLNSVQALLKHGVDLAHKDEKGRTALHVAASRGNLEIVKLLIQPNIEISEVDEEGCNAVHIAAACNDATLDVVKYLHSMDKELVKGKTGKGQNPLHLAVWHNRSSSMVYWLVEVAGVDVTERDVDGWNNLHFEAYGGKNAELLDYLVVSELKMVRQQASDGRTALHIAADKGNFVRWFVENGADVEVGDNDGWNALHFAARAGNFGVIKYLFEKKPQLIQCKDKKDMSVLHLAASNGNLEIIQWLFERAGLKTDVLDNSGLNALHVATNSGHFEVVKYLNQINGVLIHQVAIDGRSALHLAAGKGYEPLCRWLIENGVSVDHVTSKGWNALHYAALNGNLELVKYLNLLNPTLLFKKTKDDKTALHLAAYSGNDTLCQWMLEKGLAVDAVDAAGHGALHYAAINGYVMLAEYFHRKVSRF